MSYWRNKHKELKEERDELVLQKDDLKLAEQDVRAALLEVSDQLKDVDRRIALLWKLEQRLLERRMVRFSCKRKRVLGDGACVFRSVSDKKYGTQDKHLEIRAAACKQLLRWKDYYIQLNGYASEEQFLDYVQELAKPFTWADCLAITAICDAYDVTFHVLTSEISQEIEFYNPTFGPSSDVYKICASHCHWDALYLDDEYMPLSADRVRKMKRTGEFYVPEIKGRSTHIRFD